MGFDFFDLKWFLVLFIGIFVGFSFLDLVVVRP